MQANSSSNKGYENLKEKKKVSLKKKPLQIFDNVQRQTFKRHCWAYNYIKGNFSGSEQWKGMNSERKKKKKAV